MRGRPVHGGGLASGLFGIRHALGKARHLSLQPLDQHPLRRNGRVEVLNRLVLMDHTHFKLVEAGGVCHGGGISAGVGGRQCGRYVGRVMTRQLFVRRGWQSRVWRKCAEVGWARATPISGLSVNIARWVSLRSTHPTAMRGIALLRGSITLRCRKFAKNTYRNQVWMHPGPT